VPPGHRITNTEKTDKAFFLADAVVFGSSESLEMNERSGQAELVAGESLPTDTGGHDEDFLALGFEFGDPIDGDPLFRPAKLPPGWELRGSDHAMWSYVHDSDGVKRVGVFYKAAFYDRRADMYILEPEADAADV
jgi:hypothetical protein